GSGSRPAPRSESSRPESPARTPESPGRGAAPRRHGRPRPAPRPRPRARTKPSNGARSLPPPITNDLVEPAVPDEHQRAVSGDRHRPLERLALRVALDIHGLEERAVGRVADHALVVGVGDVE